MRPSGLGLQGHPGFHKVTPNIKFPCTVYTPGWREVMSSCVQALPSTCFRCWVDLLQELSIFCKKSLQLPWPGLERLIKGAFHHAKFSGNFSQNSNGKGLTPFWFLLSGIFGITSGGGLPILVIIFQMKFAVPFLTNLSTCALIREFRKGIKPFLFIGPV